MMKAISNKGFTLVELMVSILLGSVLIYGVLQVFLGNKHTYNLQEGLGRMQQNARFALDVLSRELRMSGYVGCSGTVFEDADAYVNVVDLDNDGSVDDFYNNLDVSMEGYDASGASWNPTLPTFTEWGGVGPSQGTDILVLSRMDDDDIKIADEMPSTSAELKVTSVGTLEDKDVILISDCKKAALFAITKVQESSGHLQKNLTLNTSKTLTNDGTPFGKDASVFRLLKTIYFVADSGMPNNSGVTPKALWRKINGRAAEELVTGIEDFQILYGLDTSSPEDGVANRYVTADNVTSMTDVVAIRFKLTSNSIDSTGPDGVLSRTFTQTVKLRNRG